MRSLYLVPHTVSTFFPLPINRKTFSFFQNLRSVSSILDSDSPLKRVVKKRSKILDSDDDSQDSDHKYIFFEYFILSTI